MRFPSHLSNPRCRAIVIAACEWLSEQDAPAAYFKLAAEKTGLRLQAALGRPFTLSPKAMERFYYSWLSRELQNQHELMRQLRALARWNRREKRSTSFAWGCYTGFAFAVLADLLLHFFLR